MAMEIQGKLIKVLAPITGEGRNGAWSKQEFVIETAEQYPKKICIAAWSEKISQLQRFQLGDDIRVSVNAESREYNERWFTELRAWKIDAAGAPVAANAGSYQSAAPSYQQAPPAQARPATQFQTAPGGEDSFLGGDQDDLPF
jgi:hypothetical protein